MARWTRKLRKATRPFRHWLLWRGVLLFQWLAARLPLKAAVRLGAGLGAMAYRLDARGRRTMREQLRAAYGDDADAKWIDRVARGVYENLGRSAAELMLARERGPESLRERFTVTGAEAPNELIRQGRGVIAITGHLDNWELTGAATALFFEPPTLVIARPQSDNLIEEWLRDTRQRLGMNIFSRGEDARALLRALKQGNILCFLMDQDTRGPGCFAPFFGREAWTLTGPATLALRTGAAVFFGYSRRREDGLTHDFIIKGPLELPDSGDREADAQELTRRFAELTEAAIREAPDQWVWFHKRWRTREGEERKRTKRT